MSVGDWSFNFCEGIFTIYFNFFLLYNKLTLYLIACLISFLLSLFLSLSFLYYQSIGY